MRAQRVLAAGLAVVVALPIIQGMSGGMPGQVATGHVDFEPIDEMSGIVKSGRFGNVFWVHNDSGDTARFFAVREDGTVVMPPNAGATYAGIRVVGAQNHDWEDITRDGRTLYLCDVGNNGNKRKNLGVYAVSEPDPTKTTEVKPTAFYGIRYPDQNQFPPEGFRPFDCEAVFARRGKLYFITKHRMNANFPASSATLYRMDTRFTDRENVLTKIETKTDFGGWVTAADLSPDGKTLAVLTQAPAAAVWLFDASARDDHFLSSPKPRRIELAGAKQCEGLGFVDNQTVLVTNEQRDIYRLDLRTAKPVVSASAVAKRVKRVARNHVVRPIRQAIR